MPSLKQLDEVVTMGTEEELHDPVHLPYQYCAHAQKPAPQQEGGATRPRVSSDS